MDIINELNMIVEKRGLKMNKPASEKDIEKIVKATGFEIPEVIKQILLWHNGEGLNIDNHLFNYDDPSDPAHSWVLLQAKSIVREYEMYKKFKEDGLYEEDPKDVTLPKINIHENVLNWLPFSSDESGSILFFDCSKDTYGRIVRITHDGDGILVASSFEEFIDLVKKK